MGWGRFFWRKIRRAPLVFALAFLLTPMSEIVPTFSTPAMAQFGFGFGGIRFGGRRHYRGGGRRYSSHRGYRRYGRRRGGGETEESSTPSAAPSTSTAAPASTSAPSGGTTIKGIGGTTD